MSNYYKRIKSKKFFNTIFLKAKFHNFLEDQMSNYYKRIKSKKFFNTIFLKIKVPELFRGSNVKLL